MVELRRAGCFPFCPQVAKTKKGLVVGWLVMGFSAREGGKGHPPFQSSRLRGLQAGRGSGDSQREAGEPSWGLLHDPFFTQGPSQEEKWLCLVTVITVSAL